MAALHVQGIVFPLKVAPLLSLPNCHSIDKEQSLADNTQTPRAGEINMCKRFMSIVFMALTLLVIGLTTSTAAAAAPKSPEATMLPVAVVARVTPIELKARLQAGPKYPTVVGEAEYEVERNGNREFEVEIRGVKALAGQRVDIYVNGSLVGKMKIDRLGRGEFEIETEDGDKVPQLKAGDKVELRFGKVVVATGQLRRTK